MIYLIILCHILLKSYFLGSMGLYTLNRYIGRLYENMRGKITHDALRLCRDQGGIKPLARSNTAEYVAAPSSFAGDSLAATIQPDNGIR
jgi:hypothetical protein